MHKIVTWRVFPSNNGFTESDFNWLRSCGFPIKVINPDSKRINGVNGTGYEFLTEHHTIYVTTNTSEQETWVKLYWENRAFEIDVQYFDAINTMNAFLKG